MIGLTLISKRSFDKLRLTLNCPLLNSCWNSDALVSNGLDPITEIRLPAIEAKNTYLSLFGSKVPAGFPSSVDDHVEKRLDANEFLIDQQDAAFFVTIQCGSMINVGVLSSDKAVVDRSKKTKIYNTIQIDYKLTIYF